MCDINKCSIYLKHTVEDGCEGSYCKTAYEYVQKFGLETNASYPYKTYTYEVTSNSTVTVLFIADGE